MSLARRLGGTILVLLLLAAPAAAQELTLDLDGGTLTGRIVQIVLLVTVLSLAPSILVMATSFTRIVIVLSLLRSAIGAPQTPPNAVLISLALFLTAFVMAPTLREAYTEGIAPLVREEIMPADAFDRAAAPLHRFMRSQVREKDLRLFLDLAEIAPPEAPEAAPTFTAPSKARNSFPETSANPPSPPCAPPRALMVP